MSTLAKHPLLIGWVCLCLAAPAAKAHQPVWAALVVRLEMSDGDGATELASAVPLGGDYLVTNCHAVQQAQSILIFDGKSRRPARLLHGDSYRDLCYLEAPGLQAQPVPMAKEAALRVGMPVYAAGYTYGTFAKQPGQIVGLHSCPCAQGKVIQTSAPFDRGASGGGLFDSRGNLLGILTFRAPAGGDYHFALPADWLKTGIGDNQAYTQTGQTFWQPGGSNPAFFLTACALGAKQSWQALNTLANEWLAQERDNPEAWIALGRARLGLGDLETAATAFQRVLSLNASHEVAIWELQKLEFDLNRDLLAP